MLIVVSLTGINIFQLIKIICYLFLGGKILGGKIFGKTNLSRFFHKITCIFLMFSSSWLTPSLTSIFGVINALLLDFLENSWKLSVSSIESISVRPGISSVFSSWYDSLSVSTSSISLHIAYVCSKSLETGKLNKFILIVTKTSIIDPLHRWFEIFHSCF